MVQKETIKLKTPNRQDLSLTVWQPETPPRAVIQLLHGMAEHIGRYDRTARDLAAAGYAVAGHDHKGHGPDTPDEELGYFYDRDGWDKVVEDSHAVTVYLRQRFPEVPLVLLGHSMGSFMAREFVLRYPGETDALILSGTGWYPAAVCTAGRLLARMSAAKKPAKWVDKVAFSGNNKPFEPARTPFDWLSRNPEEVDKYIADPRCGFTFTGRAFYDFFGGLKKLTDLRRLNDLPADEPVYFMSGDSDPVGQMGKGVLTVADQYRRAGVKNVTVHLYTHARHELFNEMNRDEVMSDLISWLGSAVRRSK